MAMMTEKEREILPQLITLAIQLPTDKQQYLLGYAQAVIDVMPEGTKNGVNKRTG